MVLFDRWMGEARASSAIREPMAMAVSTRSESSYGSEQLHSRMVLCKQWSELGFVFFTNYNSRKGLDLQHHAEMAALFYWDPLARQVLISGTASKTSREDSVAYWNTRPRESQLSQFISAQSQPLESREKLEKAWEAADVQFKSTPIPCPEHWGGYLIRPNRIEFWVGRTGRLHDRYQFEKSGNHWTFLRLYP
jgi:pyridoxamine 5'-phosphate oxidase